MTKEAYRAAVQAVIRLCACAVRQEKPAEDVIAGLELAEVYQAARDHQVTAAVGMALQAAGIQDARFRTAIAMAQRKLILLDADRRRVLAAMEEAGIWYLPLKGILLKEKYPRFGMREMADNDILFDSSRAAELREIMTGLGFTCHSYNIGVDDEYYRPPVSNFEMHRELFGFTPLRALTEMNTYLRGRIIPEADSHARRLSPEDTYLYLTAHEYKHYQQRGTGFRPLLDIYVFLQSEPLDMEYISQVAERMGLGEFERRNRELALRLFAGEELDAEQREMLDRMSFDGAYGTMDGQVEREIQEKGKWRFFLSRLTIPYENMLQDFPLLRKAPILYPFFWVARLFRGVLFRREHLSQQVKGLLSKQRKDGEAA